MFFLITATTFSSLGLVLPAMVARTALELGRRGHAAFRCWVCCRHHHHYSRQPDPPLWRARHVGRAAGDGGRLSPAWRWRMGCCFISWASAGGAGLHAAGHRAGHLSVGAAVSPVRLSPSGFISPWAAWAAWRGHCFISGSPRSRRIGAIIGWPRWSLVAAVGLISAVLVDVKTDVHSDADADPATSPTRTGRSKGRCGRRNSPSWPRPTASSCSWASP